MVLDISPVGCHNKYDPLKSRWPITAEGPLLLQPGIDREPIMTNSSMDLAL